MKIIFFGSSHFALPSLKALADSGHRICCVVTQPDRKKGRGLTIARTVIKDFALKSGLKIYQPERINTPDSINFLKKFNPDLFIVIAYGQILSQELLDIPAIMALNVHASLLPSYRGAAPINWAIINGETQTGITLIKMTKDMDAGPVITQKGTNIDSEDTFITLESKLSGIAAELLIKSFDSLVNNNYNLTPQDENKATFAPKIKKQDGLIDWGRPASDICNLIKGCLGWPEAFTYYKGRRLKIYKAKSFFFPEDAGQGPDIGRRIPGGIIEASKRGIVVMTGNGSLIIEELQLEGKRMMNSGEFVAGHKISPGETLGSKK